MLDVLYVGMKYDYGDPNRGLCHEYVNFYGTLTRMKDVRVELFAFDEILRDRGWEEMNRRLLAIVREKKPAVCFFVLFTDEIAQDTIRWITERSGAVTVNWFTDDHWRFDVYSKFWAPCFHWIVTTDIESVEKYHRSGYHNAILSQWGFNHFRSMPTEESYLYDVSFIGQMHSVRRKFIENLAKHHIRVNCWGKGWKNGMLASDEMIRTLARSKINLNFTASSNALSFKRIAKIFLSRRCDDSLHFNSIGQMRRELWNLFANRRLQIKGRNFEIPGHGGFLLTGYADRLEHYYVPDAEIAIFRNFNELVEKISYYLDHDDEREKIRIAGQRRTLRDHTYERRFNDIFARVGLLESGVRIAE